MLFDIFSCGLAQSVFAAEHLSGLRKSSPFPIEVDSKFK